MGGVLCSKSDSEEIFEKEEEKKFEKIIFNSEIMEVVLNTPTKVLSFLKKNTRDIFLHISLGQTFNFEQAKAIAEILKSSDFYTKLDFDLGMYSTIGSFLEDEGVCILLDSLKNLKLINILQFRLCLNYNITNKTLEAFSQILNCKSGSHLNEFYLSLSQSKITVQGIEKISNSLVNHKYLKKIELVLGQNNLKNEGVIKISNIIGKNLGNLKEIYFSLESNKIENEGIKSLAKAIRNNSSLLRGRLELQDNLFDKNEIVSLLNEKSDVYSFRI